jgi:diguanylate cyclase (GGDEF)-like protein
MTTELNLSTFLQTALPHDHGGAKPTKKIATKPVCVRNPSDNFARTDFIARIGGDEFAIILFDCSLQDNAEVNCSELGSSVAGIDFRRNAKRFWIGVSVGLHTVDKDCGSLPQLKEKADSACYIAKQTGGNCAVTHMRPSES